MQKIALLIPVLFIAGFIYLKIEPKILSPLGQTSYLSTLTKALDGVVPVEYSDRLIASVSGITVIFPKSDNYDNLVRALQMVLNRATMENKPVEIDLRFNKPVLRYGT